MFTDNHGFTKEVRNFKKVITAANRLHPAFIIDCGDLVNRTNDPAQIAEYKRIVAKLDPSIPLYNVPGNHDVGNAPTASSLANYRKNFGPDYYSFQYGNLYGIVINSSLFKDHYNSSKDAEEQAKWLKSELKKAKKLGYANIVLFEHIPWFIHNPNEKNGYFNISLKRRKKYLKLFHHYGVKYIFAGHLHKNVIGKDGDLTIITTSAVGKPLGKAPSGFRIVKVDGPKMTYPYYSLDSIPRTVELKR
jgi:3',5'-cyclic AMP phosphodiesterase CpdA